MATKDKSILIRNVYHMLAYAFRALRLDEYEDLASEDFEHMHELFAAILSKGIARQVKQGLYREYVGKAEDLATVRGKVELSGTIRNRLARRQKVSCEYDELSENNLLNQVLKTTSMVLLRHGEVGEGYRAELRRVMLFFSGVDEVDPSAIRWGAIRFQRGNASYRFLLSVCQLVLDGMLIATDAGDRKLARFVDDQRMSRLYEKFILEYYREEHPEVSANAEQVPWAGADAEVGLLPIMQTDITLRRDRQVVIIDAKYYMSMTQESYGVHTLHSGNLYQIFTYVKNMQATLGEGSPRVKGMLMYARTDERLLPDGDYHMSGNEISIRSLDLSCDFEGIRAQLDEVIEKF